MAISTTAPTLPPTPTVINTPSCFISNVPHFIVRIDDPAAAAVAELYRSHPPDWETLATLKLLMPAESADLVIVGIPEATDIIRTLTTRAIRLRGWR